MKRVKKKRPVNSSATKPKVDEFWRKLLLAIPGYDPFFKADDFWFDEKSAQRAIDFFRFFIKHVDGEKAGEPFVLERWQQSVMANLFGWKDKNNLRRYTECFVYVPRKNGKTTWSAGTGLFTMACEGEERGRIYSTAKEREQASIIFGIAKDMVQADEELNDRFRLFRYYILYGKNKSVFKALSAEAKSKFGMRPTVVINDELHVHDTPDLVDSLQTAMGATRQPLTIHLTTADTNRESLCNEKYGYAKKVRDRIYTDESALRFLPVIYEADKDADWTDPQVWRDVNPNLGVTITEKFLHSECEKAMKTPRYINQFKRFYLNIQTSAESAWIPVQKWQDCRTVVPASKLAGLSCWGGLDLSSVQDISAFVLVFIVNNSYVWLPYFWIPEEFAFEKEKKDRVPYSVWAQQGFLEMTPGNLIDYDVIRKRIQELGQMYQIEEVAYDRYNATQIVTQLQGDGFNMIPFGQGFISMSGPSKEFETAVLGGKLVHNNNPVLTWMVANAMVLMDAAGNIKPAKNKSRDRIDGVVAGIMGLGRASLTGMKTSVYDEPLTEEGA